MLWTKDINVVLRFIARTSTFLVFFIGFYLILTENASFSKKCAIPLGYFASCLDPELTKTNKKKKERESHFIQFLQVTKNSEYISTSKTQLTSNCAEFTKLVLGSNFEAIF